MIMIPLESTIAQPNLLMLGLTSDDRILKHEFASEDNISLLLIIVVIN